MRTFLEYLKDHPGLGVQLRIIGEHGDHDSVSVDVLEYDETGVTVGRRGNPADPKLVEFYPWTAVVSVLTTLSHTTVFPTDN